MSKMEKNYCPKKVKFNLYKVINHLKKERVSIEVGSIILVQSNKSFKERTCILYRGGEYYITS